MNKIVHTLIPNAVKKICGIIYPSENLRGANTKQENNVKDKKDINNISK